jgi:hypothetical protein
MKNLSNQQRRQVRGLTTMTLLLIGFLYLFYFNSDSQENITFGFVLGEEWKLINEWTIASRSGAILFLAIAAIGGDYPADNYDGTAGTETLVAYLQTLVQAAGVSTGALQSVSNTTTTVLAGWPALA